MQEILAERERAFEQYEREVEEALAERERAFEQYEREVEEALAERERAQEEYQRELEDKEARARGRVSPRRRAAKRTAVRARANARAESEASAKAEAEARARAEAEARTRALAPQPRLSPSIRFGLVRLMDKFEPFPTGLDNRRSFVRKRGYEGPSPDAWCLTAARASGASRYMRSENPTLRSIAVAAGRTRLTVSEGVAAEPRLAFAEAIAAETRFAADWSRGSPDGITPP